MRLTIIKDFILSNLLVWVLVSMTVGNFNPYQWVGATGVIYSIMAVLAFILLRAWLSSKGDD